MREKGKEDVGKLEFNGTKCDVASAPLNLRLSCLNVESFHVFLFRFSSSVLIFI